MRVALYARARLYRVKRLALVVLGSACLSIALPLPADGGSEREDIYSQDVARFTRLLSSRIPERRVEGVQGLSHLKHWPSEEGLLALLNDDSTVVRREVVFALSRLGTVRSIPHLIALLDDPWWELRANALLALRRMTAEDFPSDSKPWKQWWQSGTEAEKEQRLLASVTHPEPEKKRKDVLCALGRFARPVTEKKLLHLLSTTQRPPLTLDERSFIIDALERVGTEQSIPVLARESSTAAWALGRVGGADAEQALLKMPKDLPVLINLDRLKSTNAGAFIPALVDDFGLITYRSQPDDLHLPVAQPIQRVAANLIIRSGQGTLFIDAVLRELEATMNPPARASSPVAIPPAWKPMLEKMHNELKAGFVRGDGRTTSQPITALYHVAEDPALAPRLIPLLQHPAVVPRVYVAMLLGKLRATEAVPVMVNMVREPYTFSDATALASGKHADQSQTVRWRGFLCMALGKLATDEARQALESFAADPAMARDIRYSAVVGLGFTASPKSLPVLRTVATNDVIWMVRDTARQVIGDIEILTQDNLP